MHLLVSDKYAPPGNHNDQGADQPGTEALHTSSKSYNSYALSIALYELCTATTSYPRYMIVGRRGSGKDLKIFLPR